MAKNNYDDVEVVFRLKPLISDVATCEIKHVGYMGKDDKLGDEIIELETPVNVQTMFGKNTDYLGKINKYDITVNAYKNNMTGSYLLKNVKLPVMSLQFMYKKNIVVGYLFNIFIYFELDTESARQLISAKKYVGARVTGKYVIGIELGDDLLLDENKNKLKEQIEKFAMEDIADELTNSKEELSEEKLKDKLLKNIEEKTNLYNSLIEGYDIGNFKNNTKFFNENLKVIYKNKHLEGLIKFALDVRNKKRIKQYGGSEEPYKIPEKIFRYKDYKNDEKLIEKYLNISDSDYDE
jgi:hypothetical protein